MRIPSRVEVGCIAFGVFAAAAFAAVSVTINSAPSPPVFDGWVAVLQQGRHLDSKLRLSIVPEVAGGEGGRPVLRYSVAVCGPDPFEGALLLGDDARLDEPQVLVPPASFPGSSSTERDEPLFANRTLKVLDVPTGLFRTYSDVQVIRLALPASRCIAEGEEGGESGFFGTAALVSGRVGAAVNSPTRGPLGLWAGPRSTQSWPYVGTLPGLNPSSLGEFRFVRGLEPGPWMRPPSARFEVGAGSLAQRASVDFARPDLSSSTALSWSQREPYAAAARVTDVDSLETWQTWLVLASIALAVGATYLAAVFLPQGRGGRSRDDVAERNRPQIVAPPRRSRGLLMLVLLALLTRWPRERRK